MIEYKDDITSKIYISFDNSKNSLFKIIEIIIRRNYALLHHKFKPLASNLFFVHIHPVINKSHQFF